jgi:hypothetical protein
MRGKAGLFSRFQPFSPTSLAGLTGWWDASDSDTLFDASSGGSLSSADGAVGRWEDKSGNGRHFTQSVSGSRPVRKTSIQNGRDAIRLDGSDDALEGSVAISSFVSATASTVFVVARAASASSVVLDSDSAHGFFDAGSSYGSSGFVGSYAAFAFGQQPAAPSIAYSVGDWKALTTRHGDGSLEIRLNGASATSASVSSRLFLTVPMNVGVNFVGQFFDGDVGEIIAYNVALSTPDREAVEAYLIEKWGLT